MGDLSKNFSRSEFACRCGCGFDDISSELIVVLEGVRLHFGSPVKITSGCRCEKHNASVGGAPKSQHVQGIAADIVVAGISSDRVADYLELQFPERYGVGRYSRWTHIDVRHEKARWRG
ncbi:Peptidase M15 [Pantoea sesami]|nr:Peptidase M15 [Pantoea sesami]